MKHSEYPGTVLNHIGRLDVVDFSFELATRLKHKDRRDQQKIVSVLKMVGRVLKGSTISELIAGEPLKKVGSESTQSLRLLASLLDHEYEDFETLCIRIEEMVVSYEAMAIESRSILRKFALSSYAVSILSTIISVLIFWKGYDLENWLTFQAPVLAIVSFLFGRFLSRASEKKIDRLAQSFIKKPPIGYR